MIAYQFYVDYFAETCPKIYQGMTFKNTTPTEQQKQQWDCAIKNISQSLFVSGGIGTGKTLLTVLCGRAWVDSGFPVIFANTTDLFRRMLNEIRSDAQQDILYRCLTVDVLIIDDLGKEKLTEWVGQNLYNIIDCRTSNKKVTYVSSNFSLGELARKLGDNYGQAIVSRISGTSKKIVLTGDDIRIKNI